MTEDKHLLFAKSPRPQTFAKFEWSTLSPQEKKLLLKRPAAFAKDDPTWTAARSIIDEVRREGDKSLWRLGREFDGWHGPWTNGTLGIAPCEWDESLKNLTTAQVKALERALIQIENFHALQKPRETTVLRTKGLTCWRRVRPLAAVGIYIPGGNAPLPSSFLMSAVPAQLAGCKQIIAITPANSEGWVHPAIIACAKLTGVTHLFRSGGAQAIAALAYGTEEVPKVDKIFGPGNRFVTAAKSLCAQDPEGCAIDMPAGPSEVLVVADGSCVPAFVASDLLSQAEHGTDSHVVLVLHDASLYGPILKSLEQQLAELSDFEGPGKLSPRERARQSLSSSVVIYAPERHSCLDVINTYAPEHLILHVENSRDLAKQVEHAGSIFLGPYTPESLGDYASGTNHVLPTGGAAKSTSGLGLEAFFKSTTIQEATPEGLLDLAPTVTELALMEGLEAHARAVTRRTSVLQNESSKTHSFLRNEEGEGFEGCVKPLIREVLQDFVGYDSARYLESQDAGHPPSERIFLDANEHSSDPWGQSQGLNRYPDPQPIKLVHQAATYYKVEPQNLLVTSGADQGIDLILRSFSEGGLDRIVVTPPTYGYYEVAAAIQGAKVEKVPLLGPDFALDLDGIERAVFKGAKTVFICSPNNPTGMSFNNNILFELAERLKGRAILVLDEAYGEFTETPLVTPILRDLWPKWPHVVVLRTLSKAFGLAGLRMGFLLAHHDLINFLQKVRPPYPLSQTSIDTALKVFAAPSPIPQNIEMVRKERYILEKAFAKSPLVTRVLPSETNFILVSFGRYKDAVFKFFKDQKIIVRDRSRDLGLDGCLRITVGSEDENRWILKALAMMEKEL